ncbi:uncharacterized protein VTP21DRAFT_10716 [Calcarisporiella thermophila]|uniref:uncharacterized protein n=1 Tax=Calcarisporiella thermophila TaxID=911321 RepID=UPI0037440263
MPSKHITIRNHHDERIVGTLETRQDIAPAVDLLTGRKKLAILCHGVFSHRDYLFLSPLAKKLPFESFRFDFRGCGESDGKTRFDIWDVGGCVFKRDIPHVINLAGSFNNQWLWLAVQQNELWMEEIENLGYYKLIATYRRYEKGYQVSKQQIDNITRWDMNFISSFPPTTSVLTCHGTGDTVTPVAEVMEFR